MSFSKEDSTPIDITPTDVSVVINNSNPINITGHPLL
jgi:hypothetical protein